MEEFQFDKNVGGVNLVKKCDPIFKEKLSRTCRIGMTVINFNTSRLTLRCIDSFSESSLSPDLLLILDNSSEYEDFNALCCDLKPLPHTEIRVYRSSNNLGFAAGSNFLLQLLEDESCNYLGLLNNDAVARPDMVRKLVDSLSESENVGISGGRMHKLLAADKVDTLGISMYASLMPADRLELSDPYLGPTGGCCMMTRGFANSVKAVSGYIFDERYFCYCEDTDLVIRANLLGFSPGYLDEILALHEGQASSSRAGKNFIAYHGLRNSIWMQLKLIPASIAVRHMPLLVVSHAMLCFKYFLVGDAKLIFSIYRDAWKKRKIFMSERKIFNNHVKISSCELAEKISPKFYRKGYFKKKILDFVKNSW